MPLKLSHQLEVTPPFLQRAPEKVLFYMFYNMPFDRQQVEAAQELERRGWKYKEADMRWYKREVNASQVTAVKHMFDPEKWEIVSQTVY